MNNKLTRSEIAVRVYDAYRMAAILRLPQTKIIERMDKLRTELRSKTPKGRRRYHTTDRAFLQGLIRAHEDMIYRELEFVYRSADGVLFSTSEDSVHRKTREFYDAGRGSELGNMQCAHVWRGSDRPYGEWTVPNDRTPRVDA